MVDLHAMGYEAKCYELAGFLLSCDNGNEQDKSNNRGFEGKNHKQENFRANSMPAQAQRTQIHKIESPQWERLMNLEAHEEK